MACIAPKKDALRIESDGTSHGTRVWINGVEIKKITAIDFHAAAGELPDIVVKTFVINAGEQYGVADGVITN